MNMQFFCFVHFQREVVFLALQCEDFDLFSVGLLIIVDQAYNCGVVCKLDNDVRVPSGHTVIVVP